MKIVVLNGGLVKLNLEDCNLRGMNQLLNKEKLCINLLKRKAKKMEEGLIGANMLVLVENQHQLIVQ